MLYIDAVLREDAIEHLIRTHQRFPQDVPPGASKNVSHRIFGNWRWVRLLDGEVVFANCIQECIRKEDFDSRKKSEECWKCTE
ncbi:hypothetical protein RJ498_000841 [Pluralibacter gergoviae]